MGRRLYGVNWTNKIVSLAINPQNISFFIREWISFQPNFNQHAIGWQDTRQFVHIKNSNECGHFSFWNRNSLNKREMRWKESRNGQRCIGFKNENPNVSFMSASRIYGIIKPWYHPQFAIIGCHFISIINQFSNWPRNWCGEIVDIYGKISSHWMDKLNAIHFICAFQSLFVRTKRNAILHSKGSI